MPFRLPGGTALLDDPQAHHIFEQAIRAVHPAFVGHVRGERGRGQDRVGHFQPREAPRPTADVSGVRGLGRHGGHRAPGVVTGGGDDGDVFVSAEAGSGLDDFGEDSSGQFELFQHRKCPGSGRGVEHLRGGRVAEFAHFRPGEPVVEQIRRGEEGFGDGQLGGIDQTHQLIERVDGHELDAGLGEHVRAGDAGEDGVHHPIGALIPVVNGVADQPALCVEQAEVHAPGVHAEAGGFQCLAFFNPGLDVAPQTEEVPVQGAVDGDGDVGETVQFFEGEGVSAGRINRAIEVNGHHPPGFGTEVNGEGGKCFHLTML